MATVSDKQLLNNPITIRFSGPLDTRLGFVSRKYKIKKSEVVRRALEHKLPDWENGNRLVLEAVE